MPNKSNRWETKACHPQRCIDRLHGVAMPYNCFAPLPVKGVTSISHHLTRQATQKLCLSQLCQSPERIFDRSKFDVASKPHVHVRVPPFHGATRDGVQCPPNLPRTPDEGGAASPSAVPRLCRSFSWEPGAGPAPVSGIVAQLKVEGWTTKTALQQAGMQAHQSQESHGWSHKCQDSAGGCIGQQGD